MPDPAQLAESAAKVGTALTDAGSTPLAVAVVAAFASIVVGVLAAFASITAALISAKNAKATAGSVRQIEHDKLAHQDRRDARVKSEQVSRYSEPLARAAYDLQSRIFNILKKSALRSFVSQGDDRQRTYMIENTTFLVAQFFCWSELVRLDVQLINLGENAKTRQIQHLLDEISRIWGTDSHAKTLRIFAGEQRAIGEALVTGTGSRECIGYGKFVSSLGRGKNALLDFIRDDLKNLSSDLSLGQERLRALQNAFIDLLALLDPDGLRFPPNSRSKL